LLTNFDLDVTYLRVDKELADLSIKELFSDLIWRFCRTSSDDQIRKSMLRTFKKQRSDMVLVRGGSLDKSSACFRPYSQSCHQETHTHFTF